MFPALSVTLTVLLPLAAALQMNLSPKKVLYKVGDREEIKCSMNECPEEVKFSWGSLGDKPLYADYKTSPKESVLIFSSVTKDHENIIKCTAKCKEVSKQATATVKVYSFAKDPVISGHDSLVLGVKSTLTCEVTDVYPAEYMEVEWLRGDTVMHTQEGQPDTQTIRSDYTFTPQRQDDGEQITCRASLMLPDIPPDQSTRETTISLTILSAPSNVRGSGSTTVPAGSALSLTCDADGSPEPVFSWNVLRPDGQRVRVGETRELSLPNVTLSDAGDYECEASNRIGKKTATVTVTIHGPPTNTVISVSPDEPKEDESVTISCVSSSVTESHLVLSKLLDGAETELASDEGPRISLSYSSASINDSGLYVCKAFNDYGSQEASVQLLVQAHPLEVTLQPDLSVITVERGSVLSLSCEASGCPHPHFTWKGLEDKPRYRSSDTQTAVSQLNLGPVGPKEDGAFICEVKCGSVVKSKRTEVKIFSFPSHPAVESSGTSLEGEMTNLTCTVHDVFPADRFRTQWLDGETELFSQTWSFANGLQTLSSVFSYQPNGSDHDKNISCKVSLEMDGVPAELAEKTASITLAMHYAPRQTTITVSPQKELKEGENISISCLTDSAPEGHVVLRKVLDGEEIEVASSEGTQTFFTIHSAELSDSGDYVCEAVNQYGSHRASTQISVQAPPRNTTVKVLPSTSVQEGQNITICCHSVSFPPPAIILRKLDSGIDIYSPNGTFTLINLTPNDTGLYQINVTNALGYETEVFSIHVMERLSSPPPSWNIFITPFLGLGLLTSAAVVLEYLRRARLKGFYELSKCQPGTV
ncbi:vascular cell adhesion protein 1b [Colossoma macropomum]|uniref:vascular cell adhesion protein 1b n=1 Tax=Colossoma macropomum TaxID=42526 RepID=UPI00186557E3|nr:vascular cell adhesion protein 1b [Colossoma macropomum]